MIEETIVDRLSGLSFEELDREMRHIIKRNILDSYAGICGSLADTDMLRKFDRYCSASDSRDEIAVWGTGNASGIADAIFMNTILGRRSDLLNTYFSPNAMGVSHPSDNVSLVFTLADWLKLDGPSVMDSVYTAYFLSGVFSNFYCPEAADYDHDATALFYTALTIGRAKGLSRTELIEAQRIVGMLGLDVNQSALGQVTDWKHCTYASCAMRALLAVRMASAGFEGPPEIYEGDAGIGHFFPQAEAFLEPLPDLASVVFKRWPALVFCQTPIDVALDLAADIPDTQAIVSVEISTYDFARRIAGNASSFGPDSRAGRTHSLPYCVSVALLNRTVGYSHFDAPFADNPDLAALMAKTTVLADPELTKLYPQTSSCRIDVRLADGTALSRQRDYPHGDPRDPMSDDDLGAKLKTYFPSGDDDVDGIIGRIWNLESEGSIDFLLDPLRRKLI